MQGVEREERRSVLRHVMLSITLLFHTISPVVRKKWPTLHDMVTEGESSCYPLRQQLETTCNTVKLVEQIHYMFSDYLTAEEAEIIGNHDVAEAPWLSFAWACRTVHRARQEGRIASDFGHHAMIKEILFLRVQCGKMHAYNKHNVPLVYAQVG